MPWTTPPTFVNGAILSAAQLNIHSDNLDYLYGIALAPNIPFLAREVGQEGATWYFRYRLRYIHYYYDILHDPSDDVKIYVNGTQAYHDGTPDEGSVAGAIDLNSLGLTSLNWYAVNVVHVNSGNSVMLLKLLKHSNSATP